MSFLLSSCGGFQQQYSDDDDDDDDDIDTQSPSCCCNNKMETSTTIAGGDATDVILVSNPSNDDIACSDFCVWFPRQPQSNSTYLKLCVDGQFIKGMEMIWHGEQYKFQQGLSNKPSRDSLQYLKQQHLDGKEKTCAHWMLYTGQTHELLASALFDIYNWSSTDKIVVCDIDGTITKSNIRGMMDSVILERNKYAHKGVCHFLSSVVTTCRVRMLYLTARPMSMVQTTRSFLKTLQQKQKHGHTSTITERHRLPQGPLFCNMYKSAWEIIVAEGFTKVTHLHKADLLFRQVILPFASCNAKHSLCAGFGNAITDAMCYEMVGMERHNIYLLNKQSQVTCMDRNYVAVEDNENNDDNADRRQNFGLVQASSQRLLMTATRAVRKRRSYQKLWGTKFDGFQDPRLLLAMRSKLLDQNENSNGNNDDSAEQSSVV